MTFVAYILIALPTFWFAALLKEYVATGVNDLVRPPGPLHDRRADPGIDLYGTPGEIWSRTGSGT